MGKKNNPKNASYGVDVSRAAINSLPSSDLQRLYYRSTAHHEMQGLALSAQGRPGTTGVITNGVHSSSNRVYKARTAPLMGRELAHTYTMDLCERPNADFLENKKLFEFNLRRPPGIVCMGAEKPLGAESSYNKQFVCPTADDRRMASTVSQKPKQIGRAVGVTGYSVASGSSSHDLHQIRGRGQVPDKVKESPNLGLEGSIFTEHLIKSQNQIDFRGTQRANTAPSADLALTRSASAPQVNGDNSLFGSSRICGLGPGR